jgi:hypothetical protein
VGVGDGRGVFVSKGSGVTDTDSVEVGEVVVGGKGVLDEVVSSNAQPREKNNETNSITLRIQMEIDC